MSAITDRVPLDTVSAQARQIRPGRTLLALVTGLLFGAAWLAAKSLGLLWLSIAWALTAMKVGWQQGSGRHARPSRADLLAENDALRAELAGR